MDMWVVAGVSALGVAAAAVVGGLWLIGRKYGPGPVRRAGDLFVRGAPKTVMAVLAHPGDEVTAAGALSGMARRRGAKLVLVYLTAGEAARGSRMKRDVLAETRRREAAAAGRHLRAAAVEVLDFPDGALRSVDPAVARLALGELIARHGPSVIVTFDERIGLYGHHDHMQAGRWVREIVEQCEGDESFPVRRVFHVTLTRPLIERARRRVQAFHDNYPRDVNRGLPEPNIAVRVGRHTGPKRRAMHAHASVAETMRDTQPYWSRSPGWLYAARFGWEYFRLAVSR